MKTGSASASKLFLSLLLAGTVALPALGQGSGTGTAPGQDKSKDKAKEQEKERGQDKDKAKGKEAKLGEAAPDFTLQDSAGKSFHLADFKGRVVVLQWINPDCPVCKRVSESGKVANMLKALREIDSQVAHLTINSTHNLDAAATAAYLQKNKIESPGLLDQPGTVGKMFGAKTTPHVFVIDREGILRYTGAFDDDEKGEKGDKAMNYAVNAVRQIAAGETVSPDKTRPYGCSVKYAQAKADAGTSKGAGTGTGG